MAKFISFLKTHPLCTAIIAIVIAMFSIKMLPAETFLQEGIIRMLLCGTMLFFLYQISGERTTSACGNSTGYVIKVGIGFLVFAAVVGIFGFMMTIATSGPRQDWLFQLACLAYMMLGVGLFEELTFRAILNDAIIIHFRDSKKAFLISAIVTSLVFGGLHVLGASLNDPMSILQAVLKTLSSGVFGLGLLFLYWKTRNIWACGIIHGGYDFILSFSNAFTQTGMESSGYVVAGKGAAAVCVVYIVTGLITAFITWRIWKSVKKDLDFEKLRQEW